MDDEIIDIEPADVDNEAAEETEVTDEASATEVNDYSAPHSDYDPATMTDSITHHLSGMYQTWFLDYASYVILERAVPHIMDGLKPSSICGMARSRIEYDA